MKYNTLITKTRIVALFLLLFEFEIAFNDLYFSYDRVQRDLFNFNVKFIPKTIIVHTYVDFI